MENLYAGSDIELWFSHEVPNDWFLFMRIGIVLYERVVYGLIHFFHVYLRVYVVRVYVI